MKKQKMSRDILRILEKMFTDDDDDYEEFDNPMETDVVEKKEKKAVVAFDENENEIYEEPKEEELYKDTIAFIFQDVEPNEAGSGYKSTTWWYER